MHCPHDGTPMRYVSFQRDVACTIYYYRCPSCNTLWEDKDFSSGGIVLAEIKEELEGDG